MIRTNLSTRPFYNERLVRLGLLVFLLVVAAATAFNVTRVVRYSRSDTQLSEQAARDEARAADLRKSAVRLRATVDPRQIESASLEARQANDLIDRRTFSWTEIFNLLRVDAARRGADHVVPVEDREGPDRPDDHDRGARRRRRQFVHGQHGAHRDVLRRSAPRSRSA